MREMSSNSDVVLKLLAVAVIVAVSVAGGVLFSLSRNWLRFVLVEHNLDNNTSCRFCYPVVLEMAQEISGLIRQIG
jgi:hypothetical protein